ncbi:VOC family protein [Georgenia alba]|uniref:VOC family protein n=1 Tax=Georgenia alba TaxID=2233858 RepID=A0ABW2QBB0_9MICO
MARLADDAGIPLLIDVRRAGVTIDSGKDRWEADPEAYGALAGAVQQAAHALGLTADPAPLRFVQAVIDAVDVPAVRRFWCAVLGYRPDPREHVTDIVDPRDLSPILVFQPMAADEADRRAQRNRIHLDLFVPDDQARARLDAALAAGGRIVYDDEAPEWWTVADPEGNEVDIAVSAGREELQRASRST